jgi:GTP cyclohydrolase IA
MMHDMTVLIDLDVFTEREDAPMIADTTTFDSHLSALPITLSSDHPTIERHADIDAPQLQEATRMLLRSIGDDPSREGLRETPRRVAKAWAELTAGLREDPGVHLQKTFAIEHDGLVLLRDIEFHSLCEHHLLPFLGRADVAYLPANGRVAGLSKLARVVEGFARRPQVQERLTNQIADCLVKHLQPQAVFVRIEAEHMCMKMRGIKRHESHMITHAARGLASTDNVLRRDILDEMRGR